MRVKSPGFFCIRVATACAVAACLFGSGSALFASGQSVPIASTTQQTPAPAPIRAQIPSQTTLNAGAAPTTLKITSDEAVRMALENNLGVKADRLGPQVATYNVAAARAAYGFVATSQTVTSSQTRPPSDFLSGTALTLTDESFRTNGGIGQLLKWGGGRYTVGFDASRGTTSSATAFYNPALGSTLSGLYVQPLLRNFRIDGTRQNLLMSQKQQEIADVGLRQALTQTERNVRFAYFALVSAIGSYDVAQKSLELAQTSLKNNQRRVEVGTMAPIDIVQAQAEVASTEEQVIVTQGQIQSAEDQLRLLVMNPSQPDFWTTKLEPAERPTLTPQPIDVEGAIKNALANRTDLLQARKGLEQTDINLRYFKNQKMPALDVTAAYSAVGNAGTQRTFEDANVFPPVIRSESQRTFADSLRDTFGSDFKTWSLTFNVSYPLGTSSAEASLAASRVQREQQTTNLSDLENFVVAQVRDAARQVATSLKRVETTQRARELAEQNLQAYEKRLAVGLSDTFVLFQAQRDLTRQLNNELAAIISYNRALVTFEAVQTVPAGNGGF
jgi:outer membrane protein TolC